MLPASNKGAGMNIGFPDVCLTPAAPAPVPVPYPNMAMNAMAAPFAATVKVSMMNALNMGSQIPCEQLVKTALERSADAILVSQIVTQKNIHVQHLTKLIELLEAERVRERFVLVVGGPRINNAFAKELGYDAGFGPHTTPLEVASFLAQEVVRRARAAK